MKTLKLLAFAMAAALLPLTACNDREETPEAVLAEISVDGGAMTFYAEGGRQRVTLTSEEDWSATCPDWISLSPTSGEAGKIEVVISVDSNYEGQNPGPHRYGIITFVGSETGTTASVTVSQEGMKTVSALNLATINDGAEIHLSGSIIITSLFNGGFVALYTEESVEENNDGDDAEASAKSIQPCAEAVTTNVMVFTEEELELGDEISLTAIKSSMSGVPVLNLYTYSLLSTGNEVGETEATDISDLIDSYDFSQWELVRVRVIISSDNSITPVRGNKLVEVAGTTEDVDLEMPDHLVYIIGYYVGTESNIIELYVTGVEDVGLIEERVLLSEDFNWMERFLPSSAQDSVADKNDHGANRADSTTDDEGVSILGYMLDSLNYVFYKNNSGTISQSAKGATPYLFGNGGTYYFRWGATGACAYLVFPEVSVAGTPLSATMTFDWAIKSSQTYADVRVDVMNLEYESLKTCYYEGSDVSSNYTWMTETIDLTDVDFSSGIRIGIGNGRFMYAGNSETYVVFIDNIKVTWTGAVAE